MALLLSGEKLCLEPADLSRKKRKIHTEGGEDEGLKGIAGAVTAVTGFEKGSGKTTFLNYALPVRA